MTNLDRVLKSRDIALPTKGHLVKAMVFPVVMYRCESWTLKAAEHWRIDAFELWCWRRLLRVPWTARRSNQSILKEISPRSSLEGLMLRLKLQYFGHLMHRADSLKKTLMLWNIEAGGEGEARGWGDWMWSSTRWTRVLVGSGSWWWTGWSGVLWFMGLQKAGHDWATELKWHPKPIDFVDVFMFFNTYTSFLICRRCLSALQWTWDFVFTVVFTILSIFNFHFQCSVRTTI